MNSSIASIPNMNTFMNDWICQALDNGTQYFWFEAFDEPWKIKYDTDGDGWEVSSLSSASFTLDAWVTDILACRITGVSSTSTGTSRTALRSLTAAERPSLERSAIYTPDIPFDTTSTDDRPSPCFT